MFKKGPDIDKKKLLLKASDVKKDSLTRLKHFKTLIEHLETNELPSLFRSHFSFIYHTFIDTFSTFDCNSKQRRDDLDCILFMLDKILIYNPELIKKRWQFYSITFVMQKLLHIKNAWRLRQEGIRLFILWYLILCDDTNPELQTMFGSIVPGILPRTITHSQQVTNSAMQQQHIPPISQIPNSPTDMGQHNIQQSTASPSSALPQIPIKLCSIEPLIPISTNDEQPPDGPSYIYLDSLLQFMVQQITRPHWDSPDEAAKNRVLGFSFLFNMLKKVYLQHIFPNFNLNLISDPSHISSHSIYQYVDEASNSCQQRGHNSDIKPFLTSTISPKPRRDHLQVELQTKNSNYLASSDHTIDDPERAFSLSHYQAIVLRWFTRILRQDLIPGQDELIKPGGSVERRDPQTCYRDGSSSNDPEYSCASDGNSTPLFPNLEASSQEMDVARKVIGTWPENIVVIHELFRRAFLNYFEPASMKRVVNVYKEWIWNGGPNEAHPTQIRLGYTSYSDLLQVFVLNSANAFLTKVHNPSMLDEQVEMCKRIMNIYRFMVMKIYMNAATWEQLLNVMLLITEQLFPLMPPEKKDSSIGGRIAPAYFQTFIVSWIRANLYVHISNQMWEEFHRVIKNLIRWRELIEEWGTTMSSVTRVLVKHVYGLTLTDLPLDKPMERRRKSRAMKSFSTTDSKPSEKNQSPGHLTANVPSKASIAQQQGPRQHQADSLKDQTVKGLTRSSSDGKMYESYKRLQHSSFKTGTSFDRKIRKIKSEYLIIDTNVGVTTRSNYSPHTDVIDGVSLKDPNMIIENHPVIESQSTSNKGSDASKGNSKNEESLQSKCVLLGGEVRGWTLENSVIMWRRMLGLIGNINHIDDPDNHLVAMKCLAVILRDFIKIRENLGVSVDNQSTPEQPNLVPPYTYFVGWLLEATHLPRQFKESRLTAYKLLCLMSIRRHDIELPQQYYVAFYEALHRGLTSSEPQVYASIIKNSAQLLTLELPGCTFLVQDLLEKSRSILLNTPKDLPIPSYPRDQAIQILNNILALHRPIKKLMVLRPELNNPMNLVAPGDIKTKIFDTFLACNLRPVVLDCQTRCKSLCALTLHVYQELCDKSDSLDVEKLFDTLLVDLQDSSNSNLFRINCDLLRLFAEHASILAQSRPALVSSMIQIICQLIVRLSTDDSNKEAIHCLLVCLEDWCIAVGKSYLLKPVEQLSADDDAETLSALLNESLITIVLRSLENVVNDEQYLDDPNSKVTRGSIHSSSQQSSNSDNGFNGPRERALTQDSPQSRVGPHETGERMSQESENLKAIKLACKVSHHKLVTYIGHFPFRQVGASSMACYVNEMDYLNINEQDFNIAPNVSLLVINGTTIISFIGASDISGSANRQQPVHLIMRNLCGKYSWDATCVDLESGNQLSSDQEKDSVTMDPDTFQQDTSRASMKFDSDFNDDGNSSSSLSSRSSGSRDHIGDLLIQLNGLMNNNGSSQLSQNSYKKRNSAQSVSNPTFKVAQAEETMIALLTNQRFQELNYCEQSDEMDRVLLNVNGPTAGKQLDVATTQPMRDISPKQLSFEQCRQLIQQLGYLTWEKRCKIDSLCKSARLLRELKNLDSQPSRDTHKIAVIYVANGQEDKNSILTNSSGSRAFEDFVSGLGWEVNLASHLGFKGGLQSNKSTGETSPYYCNSTTEVMFHVSTRIPIVGPADDESLNKKLRHLGNDEIHIVWSEHSRDYRRGIIPTEFGDVIIAIYPMLTFHGYYRIQIYSKNDVPLFGPLFDNCIVHQTSLASLVRATAINASRAKRFRLPYYQSKFEERNRLIDTIVQNHREKLSFEDFAVQLYQTGSVIETHQTNTSTLDATCCA